MNITTQASDYASRGSSLGNVTLFSNLYSRKQKAGLQSVGQLTWKFEPRRETLLWYSIDVQLCSNYRNRIFYASPILQTLIRVIDHKFRMIGDMHFKLIGSIMREVFVISGKLPSGVLVLTDLEITYNVIFQWVLNFYLLIFITTTRN